ncbi:MAG: FkbM family methyltransferase, partial [Acidobacteriota bacterium]|nr:FkbM family methyltransferase [Acidobacteriota bacterium]
STVKFWTVGTGAAGSLYKSHARSAAKSNSFMEVPTVTIDSLCDLYGIIPDLVKIDVEGAEQQVLHGSRKCALQAKSRFLVEMHSNPDIPMAKNAAGVLEWCRAVGYLAWYLKEATCCENPQQVEHRGRCHLLLQPSGWEYPVWLRGIKQSADLEEALIESGKYLN